jgi:hypothetical protein
MSPRRPSTNIERRPKSLGVLTLEFQGGGRSWKPANGVSFPPQLRGRPCRPRNHAALLDEPLRLQKCPIQVSQKPSELMKSVNGNKRLELFSCHVSFSGHANDRGAVSGQAQVHFKRMKPLVKGQKIRAVQQCQDQFTCLEAASNAALKQGFHVMQTSASTFLPPYRKTCSASRF